VINMALLYTLMKVLQAVVGPNSAGECRDLCKLSAFLFPLVDFSVYMFLRIRNEKSNLIGDTDSRKVWFERILYSFTIITPASAIANAVLGGGILVKGECITTPNAGVALFVAAIELILNFGFLALFVIPLQQLARDRSALDSKRVREITMRNFISCLMCVCGGVFTNVMAASLTLASDPNTKAKISPLVSLGSMMMVSGVLFSTWKAWEWQVVGIGRIARVIDENGDTGNSEAPMRNTAHPPEKKAASSNPGPGQTPQVIFNGKTSDTIHSVNQPREASGNRSSPKLPQPQRQSSKNKIKF